LQQLLSGCVINALNIDYRDICIDEIEVVVSRKFILDNAPS
jgi:hypothetical protein